MSTVSEEDRLRQEVANLKRKVEDLQKQATYWQQMAEYDHLTGAYSRAFTEEYLGKVFSQSKRSSRTIGIVAFDIDHFKEVNDTLGHDGGDRVLKQVVSVTQDAVRSADVVGRTGGEEFLIIAEFASPKHSDFFANKLCAAVRTKTDVTISIGLTIIQNTDESPEQIIKRADALLYQAKEKGRNQVVSDIS